MYKIVSQTALLEFAWNYYVKVVQKTWAKRKNGKKKGGGWGSETLFPGRKLENRRGVEGCRGCIGVLSGWEAGTRRADEGAAPLRRLSPFLEEARHAFYQFFSLSLILEPSPRLT